MTSRDLWGHLGTVLKEGDRERRGTARLKRDSREARTHCVDSKRFILG